MYPIASRRSDPAYSLRWASTANRGRMLAALFAMQPLGQLFAYGITWLALTNVDSSYGLRSGLQSGALDDQDARAIVDRLWRGVVGGGAIIAAISIIFRFAITDPGRYTLEVQDDIDRAVRDTEKRFRKWSWRFWKQPTFEEQIELQRQQQLQKSTADSNDTRVTSQSLQDAEQSLSDLKKYLFRDENIVLLLGTCGCWFLLDIAFYGLGINSPQIMALIWAKSKADPSSLVPAWNPDPTQPESTIYDVIQTNSKRLILTSALPSLVGSTLLIVFINRIGRKKLLALSFLVLFVFLLVTALLLRFAFGTKHWPVTIAFYMICQLIFDAGRYPI